MTDTASSAAAGIVAFATIRTCLPLGPQATKSLAKHAALLTLSKRTILTDMTTIHRLIQFHKERLDLAKIRAQGLVFSSNHKAARDAQLDLYFHKGAVATLEQIERERLPK
jgi:hypothetical protein